MLGEVASRDNLQIMRRNGLADNWWQPLAMVMRPACNEASPCRALDSFGTRARTSVKDAEMLIEIEMAEAELRRLGLGHVRVRAADGVACLDLPFDDLAVIVCDPLRSEVLRAVRAAGFARVAVHIDGM